MRPGLTKAADTAAGAPASAGSADKPGISSASAADGVSGGGAACPAADRSAVLPERPAAVLLPLAVFVCVILLLMVLHRLRHADGQGRQTVGQDVADGVAESEAGCPHIGVIGI